MLISFGRAFREFSCDFVNCVFAHGWRSNKSHVGALKTTTAKSDRETADLISSVAEG